MSLPLLLFNYIRLFTRKLRDDSVSAFSAQAVYFIILSFFPFVMFLLTLLQYLPFSMDQVSDLSVLLLPETVSDFLSSILSEISVKASGSLLSITAIAALWSASRGMLAIIRGLNSVYGIHETRGYVRLRIISTFYTLALVILLVLTLGFLVFGNQIVLWLQARIVLPEVAWILVGSIRMLIGLGVFALFFLLMYLVIPDRKARIVCEIPGAVLTAVGWTVFSFLFSFYIDHTNSFSLYGSLTAMVVLMLWLYFCMYIMFVGGEINVFLQTYKLKRIFRERKKHQEAQYHG